MRCALSLSDVIFHSHSCVPVVVTLLFCGYSSICIRHACRSHRLCSGVELIYVSLYVMGTGWPLL